MFYSSDICEFKKHCSIKYTMFYGTIGVLIIIAFIIFWTDITLNMFLILGVYTGIHSLTWYIIVCQAIVIPH